MKNLVGNADRCEDRKSKSQTRKPREIKENALVKKDLRAPMSASLSRLLAVQSFATRWESVKS